MAEAATPTPDELSKLMGMASWLAFYAGWLAGYGSAGGDRQNVPPPSVAYAAYQDYIETSAREAEQT